MNMMIMKSQRLLSPSSLLLHRLSPHNKNSLNPNLTLKPPKNPSQLTRRFSSPSPSHLSEEKLEDGQIPMLIFDEDTENLERDWSFLATSSPSSSDKAIISSVETGDEASLRRVMAWAPSEGFVDELLEMGFCGESDLVVVHDSLMVLAAVKERYDGVRCWYGEIVEVPEKWGGSVFDFVFIYFLPGFAHSLHSVLHALHNSTVSGSRLVISHPRGREVLEEQRKEFPQVVVSDLPHRAALEKAASDHSFSLLQFEDNPSLYLALLKRD